MPICFVVHLFITIVNDGYLSITMCLLVIVDATVVEHITFDNYG